MDLWFGGDNNSENGPGDYLFNFEQPSPTPRVGQSSGQAMLPRMSTSQSGESLIDFPHPDYPSSSHLYSYAWGPKEGWTGSQICIKLDVATQQLQASGQQSDRLVLVLGDYVLHTTDRLITGGHCRIRGGQTRILTATVPESGTGIDYVAGQALPVYIQLLDDRSECFEVLHMGELTFNPNQAVLGASGVPKREREDELVEVGRSQSQARWNGQQRPPAGPSVLPPPLPPNMVGHTMTQFDSQTMYMAAPTPTMSTSFSLINILR
jgi:hypothetical protein